MREVRESRDQAAGGSLPKFVALGLVIAAQFIFVAAASAVPHWYLKNTNTGGYSDIAFGYGANGDKVLAGDWNNDGIDTPAVVRSGNQWYLRNSNSSGYSDISFTYGNPTGMLPVANDWNKDGTDTPGMFASGNWYLRNSNSGGESQVSFAYGTGTSSPIPVTGDWDADGDDTPGIRVGNTWYLRNSNTGGMSEISYGYGNLSGHVPLMGDWDGDGDDTPGVYEASTSKFHLRNSNSGGVANLTIQYGNPGDRPVVGDWNGDGVDTIGVVRDYGESFYYTSWQYGGANHIVDNDGEIGSVLSAMSAGGTSGEDYWWAGLSPADQERVQERGLEGSVYTESEVEEPFSDPTDPEAVEASASSYNECKQRKKTKKVENAVGWDLAWVRQVRRWCYSWVTTKLTFVKQTVTHETPAPTWSVEDIEKGGWGGKGSEQADRYVVARFQSCVSFPLIGEVCNGKTRTIDRIMGPLWHTEIGPLE